LDIPAGFLKGKKTCFFVVARTAGPATGPANLSETAGAEGESLKA